MKQFTGVNVFLYTAALILGGLATLAPRASADTATVPFSAALGGGCFFGGVTAGTLEKSGKTLVGTGGGVPLTCTAGGNLSVADPTQDLSNPNRADVMTATVTNPTLGTALSPSASGGATSVVVPAIATPYPLQISMTAEYSNASQLNNGTFIFRVTLTATP
jgi:hypothetical protein